MVKKQIFLSDTDKKIAGVFGGLGEAYEVDTTLLRIVGVVLFVLTGFFPIVVVYIFAWLVIPHKPRAIIAAPATQPKP